MIKKMKKKERDYHKLNDKVKKNKRRIEREFKYKQLQLAMEE